MQSFSLSYPTLSKVCNQHHWSASHLSTCLIPALPKAELFTSLHKLLTDYPTTSELRSSLLDHLHGLLQQTLPTDPAAARLSATRNLLAGLEGIDLIDELKAANMRLEAAVRAAHANAPRADVDGMACAYAGFIEEWVTKDELDAALVRSRFPFLLHSRRLTGRIMDRKHTCSHQCMHS